MTQASQRLHGSAVELAGQGILILGPSGAGKSSLARDLIVLGANLIADDQTVLTCDGSKVQMSRPPVCPLALNCVELVLLAVLWLKLPRLSWL